MLRNPKAHLFASKWAFKFNAEAYIMNAEMITQSQQQAFNVVSTVSLSQIQSMRNQLCLLLETGASFDTGKAALEQIILSPV